MTLQIAAIKAFIVPDEHGEIDYMKSGQKYLESLKAFEGLILADEVAVKNAVAAVFDKYKGGNVTKAPAFILRELTPTPETYGEFEKRVNEYLKLNTGEVGEALLGMRKGAGGGHWRWIDKGQSSKEVVASKAAIAERDAKAMAEANAVAKAATESAKTSA